MAAGAVLAPLWVSRQQFLERLAAQASARDAGERVWRLAEPWVRAVFDLADGGVRLAEVLEWTALLDRHSTVDLDVRDGVTQIAWSNVADAPPDVHECEFRAGAIRALAGSFEDGTLARVTHVECRTRGDQRCIFSVDGPGLRRDAAHERMLHEMHLLESGLQGRESFFRRVSQMEARSGPFPDVLELRMVRRFLEEIEDIILVFDRDLNVLDANRAALRFAGMGIDSMRGLSARDLLSADSFAIVRGSIPMLLDAGSARGLVIEARGADGWAPIEVSARVTNEKQVIICTARDISEHLALERELADRNRQLRTQNQRMAESNLLKSEFLANVSHELNTPLTCIRGFARLLLGDLEAEREGRPARIDADKRQEFVQIIGNEAVRMGELIAGLMELSQIESGVVKLDRTQTWLNAIVVESIRMLKPRLDEHGLGIEDVLDPNLPQGQLDPDRMKQVVLNLLENALKFSPPGAKIRVETRAGGGMLELVIGNSSPHLTNAQLERIFDRFVQRDGSFARPEGGVGLGLNLVRAIVELHGGKVWAELPRADWVEFFVRVPLG